GVFCSTRYLVSLLCTEGKAVSSRCVVVCGACGTDKYRSKSHRPINILFFPLGIAAGRMGLAGGRLGSLGVSRHACFVLKGLFSPRHSTLPLLLPLLLVLMLL
ncbi:unnamed protein product, partial [Laminaria digitata]